MIVRIFCDLIMLPMDDSGELPAATVVAPSDVVVVPLPDVAVVVVPLPEVVVPLDADVVVTFDVVVVNPV